MKETFGSSWGDYIPKCSLEKTIDYVVTGGTIDDANCDQNILNYFQSLDQNKNLSILDFGSGIGRNAIPFSQQFPNWKIYCYDNIHMFNQMKNFGYKKYDLLIDNIKNLELNDDWYKLKTQKFDYIYATLVFQHIPENSLLLYLENIKSMTKNLLVFGRQFNDDNHKNTWSILEKAGLFPVNTSYQRDGNPEEHSWCIYQMS